MQQLAMTPEEAQRLKECISEIAAILYKNTDSSQLTSLEAIETTVRFSDARASQSQYRPFFTLTNHPNLSRQNATSKKRTRCTQAKVQTGTKIRVTCPQSTQSPAAEMLFTLFVLMSLIRVQSRKLKLSPGCKSVTVPNSDW